MIEVDHFRAYNDREGKPKGDAALRSIADSLRKLINRPGDILARYGPGKFGVVLGGTSEEGALALAEKLRTNVDLLKLPNPASASASNMTLSLGVASAKPDRDAAWQDIELIAIAERGLTQAKETGRNRVGIGHPIQNS
jgi:diguanylate cyclase (GGDEF)-like protein